MTCVGPNALMTNTRIAGKTFAAAVQEVAATAQAEKREREKMVSNCGVVETSDLLAQLMARMFPQPIGFSRTSS